LKAVLCGVQGMISVNQKCSFNEGLLGRFAMQENMTKSETSGFFQDVKDLFVQTERMLKEKSLETDQKFRETDRKFEDTDRKFQDTDRKFQDTDKRFQDTVEKFQDLRNMMGKLGDRLGDFVEEMVRPAVVRLFRERGFDLRQVFRDVTAYDAQGRYVMQVDLLAVDTLTALVVECKSRCSVADVSEHLDRLAGFKSCFPRYGDVQLFGVMAAMVMPDDVARYAYRKGLYVLAQSGDTIVIRNDEQFQPKEW